MRLRYAYNTNGLADHRLEDALALLADCGYEGVGLTLDHHHLDPFGAGLPARLEGLRRRLADLGLSVVVETGARFLLDPRRKHEPTLMSEDRRRRIGFLLRAVEIAARLEAEALCFWSGARPADLEWREAWVRLVEGCSVVLAAAERYGVSLGFEPEPGHMVDRLVAYDRLAADLGNHPLFGLTLDVGHCLCVGDEPIAAQILRRADRMVNVHIEDMRRGLHEHLYFGEGEVDFSSVLDALRRAGYRGLVCVELSRHSHAAHRTVPGALEFLRRVERGEVLDEAVHHG